MPISYLRRLLTWKGRLGAQSSRFDNYHVIKVLHEGEKAFVYQARSDADDNFYAIKAYRPLYNRTARRMCKRYRMKPEGEVGMMLNPAEGAPDADYPIIRTISHGREFNKVTGCSYIVLEFVDGTNAKRLISFNHPLLRERRLDIARTVARGLAIMHERGFIHRDLCADNIMVAKDGKAKLIDLGFVAPIGLSFREKSGTPSTMSPEQFQAQPMNPASDIYSFGIVLFEIFTGKMPFTSPFVADKPDTLMRRLSDLKQQHLRQMPPAPSTISTDLPQGMEGLILRCLQKQPKSRPSSMRHVMADLAIMQDPPPAPEQAPQGARST